MRFEIAFTFDKNPAIVDMRIIKKIHTRSYLYFIRICTFANLYHRFCDYRRDIATYQETRWIVEVPGNFGKSVSHSAAHKIEHLSRADSSLTPRPSLPVAPWNWKPKKSWCLAPPRSVSGRCVAFNGLCNFRWSEILRRRNVQCFDRV